MLTARETRGFRDFLLTNAARSAPGWQVETLANIRLPDDAEPTSDTFGKLLAVLDYCAARPDRQTG